MRMGHRSHQKCKAAAPPNKGVRERTGKQVRPQQWASPTAMSPHTPALSNDYGTAEKVLTGLTLNAGLSCLLLTGHHPFALCHGSQAPERVGHAILSLVHLCPVHDVPLHVVLQGSAEESP